MHVPRSIVLARLVLHMLRCVQFFYCCFSCQVVEMLACASSQCVCLVLFLSKHSSARVIKKCQEHTVWEFIVTENSNNHVITWKNTNIVLAEHRQKNTLYNTLSRILIDPKWLLVRRRETFDTNVAFISIIYSSPGGLPCKFIKFTYTCDKIICG